MRNIHSASASLSAITSTLLLLSAAGCSSAPLESAPSESDAPTGAAEPAAQWADDGWDDWNTGAPGWGGAPQVPGNVAPPSIRSIQEANATANNWGCDTDSQFLNFSATQWGACCDYHDSCFEQYGCTAQSWLGGSAECVRCNQVVVQCMTTSPGPGPSLCTNPANGRPCGSYRSGPRR